MDKLIIKNNESKPLIFRARRTDLIKNIKLGTYTKMKSLKKTFKWMTQQTLLKEFAPASVLVDKDGNIFYIYGSTGEFLELQPGNIGTNNNIFKMARPNIKKGLEIALFQAVSYHKRTAVNGLDINNASLGQKKINLTVKPLDSDMKMDQKQDLFLVIFEIKAAVEENAQELENSPLKQKFELDQIKAELNVIKSEQSIAAKELLAANQKSAIILDEIKLAEKKLALLNDEIFKSSEKEELDKDVNEGSGIESNLAKEELEKKKRLEKRDLNLRVKNINKKVTEVIRQEKKFLLNLEKTYKANAYLEKILSQDIHNGTLGYMIRSLYFDTLDDRDFNEKEDGIEIRRKIRLRIYDVKSPFALLEIKQKQGSQQLKRSLKISKVHAEELSKGNYGSLLNYTEPFAAECYGIMNMYCYRPKTIVQYNRKAYIAKENKIRVTLDSNIIATESCFDLFSDALCLYPVLDKFNIVLEVKYNGFLLSYIRDLINQFDGSELSVSKYCLARGVACNYNF